MMANFCKQQTNYINVLLVVRSISNWLYALYFHCIILMANFTWYRNGIIYQFQTWCFTFSCAMSMFYFCITKPNLTEEQNQLLDWHYYLFLDSSFIFNQRILPQRILHYKFAKFASWAGHSNDQHYLSQFINLRHKIES